MKGWTEQTQVRGIGDGTRHIRARMTDLFDVGDFRFILDRPHAKTHLWDAGTALQAEEALEDGVAVQEWATGALGKLEVGDTADVVAELRRAWEASGPDPMPRTTTFVESRLLRAERRCRRVRRVSRCRLEHGEQ